MANIKTYLKNDNNFEIIALKRISNAYLSD